VKSVAPRLPLVLAAVAAALCLAGCQFVPVWPLGAGAAAEPPPPALAGPALRETVLAVTQAHALVRFAAAQPQQILQRQAIQGLAPGERILGIDFRVARGVLYALGSSGRLYTLDVDSARLTPVGTEPIGWPLLGAHVAIDFNPAVDLLRVVTEAGQNLRVNPDTGRMVDFNPQAPGLQSDLALGYVNGDAHAGRAPRLVANGYTYNKTDSKLSTSYAIDLDLAQLVMQGSHETKVPPVSANSGRVMTVGPLGVKGLVDADMDISDLSNTPLAALRTDRTRLYRIDLKTGEATLLGLIGDGSPLRSIAIEP
jgi:hypothetical protein